MDAIAASVSGVTKRFGATLALDCVDFDARYGEIHAVVGENGAGKSTLIRILGGVHRPDRGSIRVDGKERRFGSPRDAIAAGIVTIPQELRLVTALSIAENIGLGALPVRRFGPFALVDRRRMRAQARAILAQLDFAPDVETRVARLPFAERQLVAIGRALSHHCRIFILDEPTAALEKHEVERLFSVLRRMRMQGTAIIYISHRLDEVVAIADRCTVLRDGRVAAVRTRGAFAVPDLVTAMTGRMAAVEAPRVTGLGPVLLRAQCCDHALSIRSGEIVGAAGLLGSGSGRMLADLFGLGAATDVAVAGASRRLRRPADAIAAGIGLAPPERMLGLVLSQSVRDNILLPNLKALSRLGVMDRAAGTKIVDESLELLDIRPRNPALPARALSGGNQQKVILAKWLARRVAVLLLDEPTQGIDVGAKTQIHALISDFVGRGGGVLIHSSDLAELARLCERVLGVRQGKVAASLERGGGLEEHAILGAIGG
ncbi:MAG: sugar ABC transporter ATP-binding protein [Xanthobacteraceae bacterium]